MNARQAHRIVTNYIVMNDIKTRSEKCASRLFTKRASRPT
jgi:hypothetical protein